MRNPKYHLYLTPNERRTVINSLIELRNNLISQGKYTDIIDELLIKITKVRNKKIKISPYWITSAFVYLKSVKITQPFLIENRSGCNGIFRRHHKSCAEYQVLLLSF